MRNPHTKPIPSTAPWAPWCDPTISQTPDVIHDVDVDVIEDDALPLRSCTGAVVHNVAEDDSWDSGRLLLVCVCVKIPWANRNRNSNLIEPSHTVALCPAAPDSHHQTGRDKQLSPERRLKTWWALQHQKAPEAQKRSQNLVHPPWGRGWGRPRLFSFELCINIKNHASLRLRRQKKKSTPWADGE